MSEEAVERKHITINFDEIAALAGVGVRRASTFLRMGLVACEHPMPKIELDGGVAYRFMKDPETPEAAEQLRDEYRAWIVGCGLKELDHYFALFLDRVWYVLEIVKLHGTRVSTSHRFDQKFQQDTNVARKLELVANALAIDVEIGCFKSLSLARNALTHAAGIVRSRDLNQPNRLEMTWVAPVMIIVDGDREILCRSEPADMHQVQSQEGAQLVLRFDQQSAVFDLGSRIQLSPHNLAEICAFYNIATSKVIEGLKETMRAKGIVADVATAA